MFKEVDLRIAPVLQFAGAFLLGKGTQFFAPLLLANILSVEQYGLLEFAMSIALAMVSALSMGTFTFIPRQIVQQEEWISRNALYRYLIVVSLILIIVSYFFGSDSPPNATQLSLLFCGILLLQGGLSATLKSFQKRSMAMILDSILWVVIILSVWIPFTGTKSSIDATLLISCGVYFFLLTYLIWRNKDRNEEVKKSFNFQYLSAGIKITIIGFCSVAIAVSGRSLVGLIFNVEQVGLYSSLYRVAILPIIVHQFIILYLFKHAYESQDKKFSNFGSLVFLCTSFSALMVWLVVPYCDFVFGLAFENSMSSNADLFLLLLVNCPIWSAIAINELAYGKFTNSNKVIFPSIAFIVLFCCASVYFIEFTTLYDFAIWHTLGFSLYYLQNSFFCHTVAIPVSRFAVVSVSCVALVCLHSITEWFLIS